MKTIQLLHNPGAGYEGYTKNDLIQLIQAGGLACRYSNTKEHGWEHIDTDVDFIVVAG